MSASAEVPVPVGARLGRRYLVALAVVGAWMLAGFVFRLSGDSYLLIGVPRVFLFQTLIARRPISELWFKNPASGGLPWWAAALGLAFMVLPSWSLVREWTFAGWDGRLWYLCAIAGAVPLAFSLARLSRDTLRPLLFCLGTAGALGVAFVVLPGLMAHFTASHSGAAPGNADPFQGAIGPKLLEMGRSFVLYVPVVYLLEEVFFRGGLDSYLHRSDDRDPWMSAGFVAALWGLWHAPLVIQGLLQASVSSRLSISWAGIGFVVMAVVGIHYAIGTPLAIAWRRSGLLFVPALVHALIDAVRNGLSVR